MSTPFCYLLSFAEITEINTIIIIVSVDWHLHGRWHISKTSRFYIGLTVGLPVFSKISIILTPVQTVLSLQGKATSRNWLDR